MFTVLGHQWERFCTFIEVPQLSSDARFATNEARTANRPELMAIIQEKFSGLNSEDLIARLRKADILCAPVNSYQDIEADPHVRHAGSLQNAEHPRLGSIPLSSNPIRFEGAPHCSTAPPALGEQTVSILADDLGLSADQIDGLVRQERFRLLTTRFSEAQARGLDEKDSLSRNGLGERSDPRIGTEWRRAWGGGGATKCRCQYSSRS